MRHCFLDKKIFGVLTSLNVSSVLPEGKPWTLIYDKGAVMSATPVKDWAQSPEVMRVRDLQQALGVSRKTAYDLANRQDFPALRFGRAIRVSKAALVRWLAAQTEV